RMRRRRHGDGYSIDGSGQHADAYLFGDDANTFADPDERRRRASRGWWLQLPHRPGYRHRRGPATAVGFCGTGAAMDVVPSAGGAVASGTFRTLTVEGTADLARELHRIGAVRFGDFVLKDGRHSPFYIDLRVLIAQPPVLRRVARGLLRVAG